MNFSKLKNRAGFTLIELIVVIAIMAILAGVAVPVYSGYIEKAEKASDLQLLGAVNSAFAAACVENDVDVYSVEAKEGTPVITSYTATVSVDTFTADFAKYFAGNETASFKVFNKATNPLLFVNGVFVDAASAAASGAGVVSVTYAGQTLYFTQTQADALANSTFGTVVGAEKLLGEVAELTNWAIGDADAIVEALGDVYYESLAKYMGFDDPQEFQDYLNAGELTEEEISAITTNGIVLYAAENFANLKNEDITSLLNSGNIYNNLSNDPATQLAQASMVYGLYTGYVNSEYYKGETVTGTDPVAAIKTVSTDDDFLEYVNSAQGQADLEAYKAAMNVINNSTANSEAMTDVLKNGYDNADLIALLESVMGNSAE